MARPTVDARTGTMNNPCQYPGYAPAYQISPNPWVTSSETKSVNHEKASVLVKNNI